MGMTTLPTIPGTSEASFIADHDGRTSCDPNVAPHSYDRLGRHHTTRLSYLSIEER
jgi:hypothetical protein